MSPRRFLVLLFTCFFTQFAVAQRVDSPSATVLTQCLATMNANAPALVTTLAKGTITRADGTTGTILMKNQGARRLRYEITYPDLQSTYIVRDGDGFVIRNGKRHQLPAWSTAYRRLDHLPSLAMLGETQKPNTNVLHAGVEVVAGRPAHHLRLSASPTDNTPPEIEDMMSEFHVYVDQASMLVVRTRTFIFSPEAVQNRTAVETYYDDYRQVGGVPIPFHIRSYISGRLETEIRLTTVSLGAAVSDADFQQ